MTTKLLGLALIVSTALYVSADSDHNNGHGHDDCIHGGNCNGQTNQGPKGDIGATGATGATGQTGNSGRDGNDGKDGRDGKDGVDASRMATPIVGELGIRLFDSRYFQLQGFYGYDFRNQTNHVAGARVLIKLGRSFEERKLDLLQQRIRQLEMLVNKYAAELL